MKKIAFVTPSLGIGGTEKSLVNLINVIPESYTITVYLLENKTDLLQDIKRKIDVKILSFQRNIKASIKTQIKRKMFINAIQLCKCALSLKLCNPDSLKYKYAYLRLMDAIKEQYDTVISYSLPTSLALLIPIYKMSAQKYLCWVHINVLEYERKRIQKLGTIYQKYNTIICVSNSCKDDFSQCYPYLSKKIIVIPNVVNNNEIILKSTERINNCNFNYYSQPYVFTCSRVSYEKRPEWALHLTKKITQSFPDFKWIWAGDGALLKEMQEKAKENYIDNNLIFVGALSNPYPLYRNCTVYAQLSQHESFCLSLAEATILSNRIVSTDFSTAAEITNGFNSCRIVHSIKECEEALCYFWVSPDSSPATKNCSFLEAINQTKVKLLNAL